MAFLTMEVSGRHARTRAIIRDTVSPANWMIRRRRMRRETSRVSFLMCPFCVRHLLTRSTTQLTSARRASGLTTIAGKSSGKRQLSSRLRCFASDSAEARGSRPT